MEPEKKKTNKLVFVQAGIASLFLGVVDCSGTWVEVLLLLLPFRQVQSEQNGHYPRYVWSICIR